MFRIPSNPAQFLAPMLAFAAALLLLSCFLEFPTPTSPLPTPNPTTINDPFTDLVAAFKAWDANIGCPRFREKYMTWSANSSAVQDIEGGECSGVGMRHVSVLVKGWTWIPDNLENLYSCRCGLSCLWTKSPVLADRPDALLFENVIPPARFSSGDSGGNSQQWRQRQQQQQRPRATAATTAAAEAATAAVAATARKGFNMLPFPLMSQRWRSLCLRMIKELMMSQRWIFDVLRRKGDPLRVYMDLEATRKPSGFEDIFIGYHAKDDVQSTYAGALFHNNRNYNISPRKLNDTLVYWSSSRCLPERNQLAKSFLSLVPHHSFGKCLNNVGGFDMALSFYPECANHHSGLHWWDHLHCAMSHYKFVLAIENTVTESYVTEKLYYALDAGSIPIYFGAPNVWDFVPPDSIIDGSKFSSMEELASYVKEVADNPTAYAEFHSWRRCGVLGNYGKARAASLDTLPCRLCEIISRKGGRSARTL